MNAIAKMLCVSVSTFWRHVDEYKTIPEPTIQVGRRWFYDAKGLAAVIQAYKKIDTF